MEFISKHKISLCTEALTKDYSCLIVFACDKLEMFPNSPGRAVIEWEFVKISLPKRIIPRKKSNNEQLHKFHSLTIRTRYKHSPFVTYRYLHIRAWSDPWAARGTSESYHLMRPGGQLVSKQNTLVKASIIKGAIYTIYLDSMIFFGDSNYFQTNISCFRYLNSHMY